MKLHFQYRLYAFVATVFAAPTQRSASIVHEKRYVRSGPERGARIDGTSVTFFRIALKQRNLENGYDYLMSVSHPSSHKYGKLWTAEEVRNTFSPSDESIEVVRSWLADAGIQDVEERRGWLVFETTIAHAEELMQSQYYEHEDLETGAVRIGCDEYHLPAHVSKHVDYVTPGIALSAPLEKKSVSKRWGGSHPHPYWPSPHHRPWGHHHDEPHSHPPSPSHLPLELQNCGKKMTPDCIRALYHIPGPDEVAKSYDSDPVNSIGVFEQGNVYIPKDLDKFFERFAPQVPIGTRPKLDSIEGAELVLNGTRKGIDSAEANIDLDIMYSLTYPQTITLYQVIPIYNGKSVLKGYGASTSIGNLLDAIDQSFCTDQDKAVGQDCGIYSPTRVISISYGAPEVDFPAAQQQRQCNEILKLGLQGHTFTVSSGDYGVAAQFGILHDTNGCITPGNYKASTKIDSPLNGTVFSPLFPQNCPYVLSVGATQLNDDQTVLDREVSMYQPHYFEFNISGLPNPPTTLGSSGGFSIYFPRPSFQDSAVDAYFAAHDPGYPYYTFNGIDFKDPSNNIGAKGGKYNRAGRGFPDVSANGAKLQDYLAGRLQPNYGTSLSAPIWASIITLINEKRTEYGKGPVGFINPVLYAHPEVFNDITEGHNPGCGTLGFDAVEGWDPVTGLGTPNFPKLLELFLKLP